MTVQFTVRLPDDVGAWIDAKVAASGGESSRAAEIARAVREQRNREAREAEIAMLSELRASGESDHPDLDELYAWTDADA